MRLSLDPLHRVVMRRASTRLAARDASSTARICAQAPAGDRYPSSWSRHLDRDGPGRDVAPPDEVNTKVIPCRDDAACAELGSFLADRIYEFNASATGYFDGLLIGGCIRNEAGDVVAGLQGHQSGGCRQVVLFRVYESHRERDYGGALLGSDDDEAVGHV